MGQNGYHDLFVLNWTWLLMETIKPEEYDSLREFYVYCESKTWKYCREVSFNNFPTFINLWLEKPLIVLIHAFMFSHQSVACCDTSTANQ